MDTQAHAVAERMHVAFLGGRVGLNGGVSHCLEQLAGALLIVRQHTPGRELILERVVH